MKIKECLCKFAIVKSKIYGMDYAINPYTGCEHACVYCYATFMKKYTNHNDMWGEFVDVKVNAPTVLKKQLKRIKEGSVLLSSVTDPYQPVEKKYEITRKCLKVLSKSSLDVSILTKSSLVLRDIDILSEMNASVGFTITTLNEDVRLKFEPRASPVSERLDAVKKLSGKGVETWVFFGPILPVFSDSKEEIDRIFDACKEAGVSYVVADRINLYSSVRERIRTLLMTEYPGIIKEYEHIMHNEREYNSRLHYMIREAATRHKILIKECF